MSKWLMRETEEEKSLRAEVRLLNGELAGVSAIDHFAQYAKIQRKLNKTLDNLKNQGSSFPCFSMIIFFQ